MTKIRLSTKPRDGYPAPSKNMRQLVGGGGRYQRAKKMKIIKFIDTCDTIIEDTFRSNEGNFDVGRSYYAGDEDENMEVLEVYDE